jgi:hypothetical protein
VEFYPVVLGDLLLPAAARLRLHRFENLTQLQQLVTIANIEGGTAGALLGVRFDANGTKFNYLEACMRAMIDGATRPLYLSSGAEDYLFPVRLLLQRRRVQDTCEWAHLFQPEYLSSLSI